MEMGKGLNRRKILLPETLDVLLKILLKECISVRKTKTLDKMLLKQLVSKGKWEKHVIGNKYAFMRTKAPLALDPRLTKHLLIRQQLERHHLPGTCQLFTHS